MKLLFPFIIPIFILFFIHNAYSLFPLEPLMVDGLVLDRATGKAVPNVTIYSNGNRNGTITNNEGRFILRADAQSTTFGVTCVGYKSLLFNASEFVKIKHILLEEQITELDEIVVQNTKGKGYPYDVLEKVAKKIKGFDEIHWGQALYRQKVKMDDAYTEFYEMLFDLNYTIDGIKETNLTNGRYAISNRIFEEDILYHYNYSNLLKLFSLTTKSSSYFITPFQKGNLHDYELKIVSRIREENSDVIEIEFKSTKNIPALEGSVWIDIQKFELLRLNGKVNHKALGIVKLKKEQGDKIRNVSLVIDMLYTQGADSILQLSKIETDVYYNYLRSREFNHRVHSNMMLYVYNHEVENRRAFEFISTNEKSFSDIDKINGLKYEPNYWEENPIVKRSSIENEVVKAFEKSGAFGNMRMAVVAEQISHHDSHTQLDIIDSLLLLSKIYNQNYTREKIFTHLSTNSVNAGDTIWFKGYLVEGKSLLSDPSSKVVYVDFIDENQVIMHNVVKNNNGFFDAFLPVPDSIPPGKYILRFYTRWMMNFGLDDFYYASLQINNSNFPVKWSIVVDTLSTNNITTLGFELEFRDVYDSLLQQLDLTCQLTNNDIIIDRKLMKTNRMGKAIYSIDIPGLAEKEYLFQIETLVNHELLKKTYRLKLDKSVEELAVKTPVQNVNIFVNNDSKKDSIEVQILKNEIAMQQVDTLYLLGVVRGKPLYAATIITEGERSTLCIPKSKLPAGFLQLTLFDGDKQILDEKVVPIANANPYRILIDTLFEEDSIQFIIRAVDDENIPVVANMSVSVSYADCNRSNESSQIDTCLYFSRNQNGDVLLSNWETVLTNEKQNPEYEVEHNLKFRGKITKIPYRSKVADSRLTLLMNNGFPVIQETQPQTDSTFVFDLFDFYGVTNAAITATNQKGNKQKLNFNLLEQIPADSFRFYEPLYPRCAQTWNNVSIDSFHYFLNAEGKADSFLNRTIDEINVTNDLTENVYDRFADKLINVDKMTNSDKEGYLDIYDLIYHKYAACKFDELPGYGTTLMLRANQISDWMMKRIYAEPLYYINDRIIDPYYDREYLRAVDIKQIRTIRILESGTSTISSQFYSGAVEDLRIAEAPMFNVVTEDDFANSAVTELISGGEDIVTNDSDEAKEIMGEIVENYPKTRTYVSTVIITTYTEQYLLEKSLGVDKYPVNGFMHETSAPVNRFSAGKYFYWNGNVRLTPGITDSYIIKLPNKYKKLKISIEGLLNSRFPVSRMMELR